MASCIQGIDICIPTDGGVDPTAPPEQRLRGRILSFIQKVADSENLKFSIIYRELTNSTGLLVEAMDESIEPICRQMNQSVREPLGPRVSEQDVQLCQTSIIAQCMHPLIYLRHREVFLKRMPRKTLPLSKIDIEKISQHVFHFSLAGIQADKASD
ncbi:MAG: CerR family C-terminal domain-containing protein [Planctomycetes bacterium]|nr:CerR family C-terminal domain-containing protein [Planctomycetota bacterium]